MLQNKIHSERRAREALESFITLRAVMLHAVKYLLIAMQFPQVHKKDFTMMMYSSVCVCERELRPELNYQAAHSALTIT